LVGLLRRSLFHAQLDMLIPISADEGSCKSWALVEMQGELERKDGGTLEQAFDVGTLTVNSSVSL
jgi:hypothetical protein